MSSILIACSALSYDKLRSKRRAKREKKAHYDARFEELQAENARRADWLRETARDEKARNTDWNGGLGKGETERSQYHDGQPPPPRYEWVFDGDKKRLRAEVKERRTW
ncbi:MAG: hypothetical protein M1832_003732 [Thelocarpon impressellum]|nr:MAG: hypothetical protein M1832_003732 [Thelocarpon impressellum]